MAKVTTARLLVRYGKHVVGETIRGTLAAELVAKGMATDITRTDQPTAKPAKAVKIKGPAPENKADTGFEV
jgi:hypothetical protein